MDIMFAKLLHALCVMPWENTRELTVALQVVGRSVRLFVTGA
jgi:hypothetical protein